jgi:copper transport outer membrane protein MctB
LFDLRYHVASLAAVFLALIIGILVGVGIASQTSVEESERRVLEQRIADLEREVEGARAEADLFRRQQEGGANYIEESYTVVMNGRLRAVRVALLFIGAVEPELEEAVTQTLNDATGPALSRSRALKLPVEPQAVLTAVPADGGELTLEEIGRRLGRELVAGGETPLWDALDTVIVEDRQGASEPEVDAVVVAHTARLDHAPTGRLVTGLYSGIASSGVPAVGVERAEARPTRIGVYDAAGLSSVDSLDTALGRVALAVLLAGGEEGQYGLKSTATAAVPPIEVLPLAPAPSG